MVKRSNGITIISVLIFLGAIFSSVDIIGNFIIGRFVLEFLGIGLFHLAMNIAAVIAIYWLWQMKKTGWTIMVILETISLIISVIQFSLFGVLIPLVILLYLFSVKKLFT